MPTEVLAPEECMRLLGTQSVGRLAVIAGGYPRVLPINFALDQGTVVFRTGPGTKLDAAQHRNVAFEVDQVDDSNRSGWSVLLTGMAEIISDEQEADVLARAQSLDIQPYESGLKPTWVRIIPSSVTGRRVGPETVLYFDLPSEAYL